MPSDETTQKASDGVASATADVEREVIEQARAWAEHETGLAGKAIDRVSSFSRRLVERVLDTERGQAAVRSTSQWLTQRLDTAVKDITSQPVVEGAAAQQADLKRAVGRGDDAAQQVLVRYRRTLTVQGAITGATSTNLLMAVGAVAADLAVSLSGLLRAAAETLAAYGEPGDNLRELAIATVHLSGVQGASDRSRGLLRTVRQEPPASVDDRVFGVLAEQTGLRLVNESIEALVRRRAQHRAVSAVPLLGAATGGVTSAWMVDRTCRTAQQVGRLRLLRRAGSLQPSRLTL
ncbi:MAG TPA: EcsC family protein [Nitriliruptorales bacterium]|nr:EcsC family protein [Nitriliruptorales bacterium]